MDWTASVKALQALSSSLPPTQDPWKNPEVFSATLSRILEELHQDTDDLEEISEFLFSTDEEARNHTKACVKTIRSWTLQQKSPSLTALCILALEKFNVKDAEYARLPLVASILGEIENDLAYHNNMHYRKVVLQLIRLIANHNEIYADTSRQLNDRQICMLLAAAAVHDLGHDGTTNTLEGVHQRARLEMLSFDILRHYIEPLGFDDPILIQIMQVMLTCTDVSPINDPRSPLAQMKAAYRWHFLSGKEKVDVLNLSPDLKPLEKSDMLTMMALLLHEADIATSAGLDYNLTKYETGLIQLEIADGEARPSNILFFLEKICNRQMLSDAGQRLYAGNIARIYALAEKDYQRGNEPYPEIMRSDFILGEALSNFTGANTTLN